MPSVYVFPGGTLNPQDSEAERNPALCATPMAGASLPLGAGFYVAAIRECFEEAGVLLARRSDGTGWPDAAKPRLVQHRANLNGGSTDLATILAAEDLIAATDRLLHWSHWITPETFPRRFDTHFFLACMPEDQELAPDPRETTEGLWVTPEQALDRSEQGTFPLVYATERQLEQLRGLASVAAALEHFAGRTVRTNQPRIVTRDGADTIVLDGEE